MAKLTTYTGASADGDWDTVGNWTNGTPATGDDVVISNTATVDLLLNIDRRADNTNTGLPLHTFTIEEGCPIDIGTSVSPMYIECNEANATTGIIDGGLFHRGSGALYLKLEPGTGMSDTALVQVIVVDSPNNALALELSTSGLGAVGHLSCLSGRTSLLGTAAITNMSTGISFINPGGQGPVVVTASGATETFAKLYHTAGTFDNNFTVTSMVLSGGVFTHSNPATAIVRIVQLGGKFNYNGGTSGISDLIGFNGIADFTGQTQNATISFLHATDNYKLIYDRGRTHINNYRSLSGIGGY